MNTENLELTKELDEEAKLIEKKREFVNSLVPKIDALNKMKQDLVLEITQSSLDEEEKNSLYKKIGNYIDGKENQINLFAIIRSPGTKATAEDAKSIFGADFIGIDTMQDLYGYIPEKYVQRVEMPINFSHRELEIFTGHDMMFVPEVATLGGKNMNLYGLSVLLANKKTKDDTPYLYGDQFNQKEGDSQNRGLRVIRK